MSMSYEEYDRGILNGIIPPVSIPVIERHKYSLA